MKQIKTLRKVLVKGYQIQAALMEVRRHISENVSVEVLNEIADASHNTDMSLGALEDVLDIEVSLVSVISSYDQYIGMLRESMEMATPLLDAPENGSLAESINYAEEAVANLRNAVDGFSSDV